MFTVKPVVSRVFPDFFRPYGIAVYISNVRQQAEIVAFWFPIYRVVGFDNDSAAVSYLVGMYQAADCAARGQRFSEGDKHD